MRRRIIYTYINTQKNDIAQRIMALPFSMVLQTKTVSWQVFENQQVYIWQKICLRYFELSQTYFRLSPLYFQLPAGSFLTTQKNIFFRDRHILYKTFYIWFCAGAFLLMPDLHKNTSRNIQYIHEITVLTNGGQSAI